MSNLNREKPKPSQSNQQFKTRLLQCAASTAAAWMLVSQPAHSAIPPECTVDVNPNLITCVLPEPDILGQIQTISDDTTITLGTIFTPTTLITLAGDGISLAGNGQQVIQIAPGSSVFASRGRGNFIEANGLDGAIDVTALGSVTGTMIGIDANNEGGGAFNLVTSDVTSLFGTGIRAHASGTDMIIDTRAGTVNGEFGGISASNTGTGSTYVATADVFGNQLTGLVVVSDDPTSDFFVDTRAGQVIGGGAGINADHHGTGDYVLYTGDVTGNEFSGIFARSQGGNVLVDTREGTVFGQRNGITLESTGSGVIDVFLADVTGATESGLSLVAGSNSTDISINALAGTITGQTAGIFVSNSGTGAVDITTSDVNGQTVDGVFVQNMNTATDLTLDSTAGTVTGLLHGVHLINNGSGETSAYTADVVSGSGIGIAAGGTGNGVTINSTAGDVVGATTGIVGFSGGQGTLNIQTANVDGELLDGIRATNAGSTLTIDSREGSVSGLERGIEAHNMGSGSLVIQTGDVSGETLQGIFAQNDGVELAINTTDGAVSGFENAIEAINLGSGSFSVTTGELSSSGANGILGTNAGTNMRIDTSSGIVSGYQSGIRATNGGSGELSIETADVTGALDVGITALNGGTDLIIDSEDGVVSGGTSGIVLSNIGTGDINLTTANVIGETNYGVFLVNGATAQNIDVDSRSGTVTGALSGVVALQEGEGYLSIFTGDVTGENEDGIVAENIGGTDIKIDTTAGHIFGADNGINVDNFGSGSLNIRSGTVTGDDQVGIVASNTGTDLTIDSRSGSVSGRFAGIGAVNTGSGELSIHTANVFGGSDVGILALNQGTDLIVDTTTGNVHGETDGLRAINFGSGILDISTGDVLGDFETGITAIGQGTGVNLHTVGGTVQGQTFGILAGNNGSSDLTISTADVNGVTSDGIRAENGALGTDLNIDTSYGRVSGQSIGIFAVNEGSGQLSITTGQVTASENVALLALNNGGTDLIIDTTAGEIQGQTIGINAQNQGTGMTQVFTGDVNSNEFAAVLVTTGENSSDVHINTSSGQITGQMDGVDARHMGTGNLTILSGNVSSLEDDGIFARLGEAGNDLAISVTEMVSGANGGIDARSLGMGSVDLTINTAYGQEDAGVLAVNSAAGTDLTVLVSNMTSSENGEGAWIVNRGTGITHIDVASATSENGTGLRVFAEDGSGTTILSSGSIAGAQYGILAESSADLNVIVDNVNASAGTAMVMSGAQDIEAEVSGAVSGANGGIFLTSEGAGSISLVIGDDASVNGGAGYALDLSGVSTQGETQIENNGVIEDSANGNILLSGTVDVFQNSGTVENAIIAMGAGSDEFVNTGQFYGVIDGQSGADFIFNSGIFVGSVTDIDGLNFQNAASGYLETRGPLQLGAGILTNEGEFSSGGSGSVFTTHIDGNFSQSGSGILLVDIDPLTGESDLLQITGTADFGGFVQASGINPLVGEQSFLIVEAQNGITDSGVELINQIISPAVTLGLEFVGSNELYLTSTIEFNIDGQLSDNQTAVADHLNDVFEADVDAITSITDILLANDITTEEFADVLSELSPTAHNDIILERLIFSDAFSKELHHCRVDYSPLAKGEKCSKVIASANDLDFGSPKRNSNRLSVGGQYFEGVMPNLTLGLGLGFEDIDTQASGMSEAVSQRIHAGGSLFYDQNGWSTGFALSASFGEFELTRNVSLGGAPEWIDSKQDIRTMRGDISIARQFNSDEFYIRPKLSVPVTLIDKGSVQETGGDASLVIDGGLESYVAVNPSVQAGTVIEKANGTQWHPYIGGSANIWLDNEITSTAQFKNAPIGVGKFETISEFDQSTFEAKAGLSVKINQAVKLGGEYTQYFGNGASGQRVSLRGSVKF